MLLAAEIWALTVATLNRLRRNDRAMIRWICNVKANGEVSSDSLLSKVGLYDIYRCGAPLQKVEMIWTCSVQQRLDCSSTQNLNLHNSCTEKIRQAKEIMG